jgi:hypothetical protein
LDRRIDENIGHFARTYHASGRFATYTQLIPDVVEHADGAFL